MEGVKEPTALGTFLMAFPPAWMLHRRRMNSFSVVFFFVVVPCTYVLAYIIIFIEEAWKRATNKKFVSMLYAVFSIVIHIVIQNVIQNVIQKLYTVLYYSCYTQLCIEYPYAKLYTCG